MGMTYNPFTGFEVGRRLRLELQEQFGRVDAGEEEREGGNENGTASKHFLD